MSSMISNLWGNKKIRRQFILTTLLALPYYMFVYTIAFGVGILGMGLDDSTVWGKVVTILMLPLVFSIPLLAFLPIFWMGRTVRRLLGDTKVAIVAMGVMFITLLLEVPLFDCFFSWILE